MRFLLFLLFLCLLIPAGRELTAQNTYEQQKQVISEASYNITTPVYSEDDSWLTIRKRSWTPSFGKSELDKDTVLILDIRKPEKVSIAATRQNVRYMNFVGNDQILLSGAQQTELLNLEEQTSIYFKRVKKVQTLENNRHFVLHYNDEEKNRLEIHDSIGNFLNGADHISKFYTTERSHIYAITDSGGKEYKVVFLTENKTMVLYASCREIEYLVIDPGEKGLMVFERSPDGFSREVLYLDLKNKMTYPLKEVLPVTIQSGFTEVIREGDIYFLEVQIEKEKPDDTVVDIWYGTDNQLEEKFYPSVKTLTYVWEPHKHSIQRIGNEYLTFSSNLVNNRYFLSFDPFYLQNYTTESTPLLIYVYDRIQKRYSMLDTITRKLYLSGDAEYALSSKDEVWYLYHIPSGSKKVIKKKGLGNPWFTNDGNAVLFEGEGALWKYELKRGILTEAAVFKGCQTSIINGLCDIISTGQGRFSKRHVNLLKPLLIKLHDPLKNLTSYCLWQNGKYRIIIAPTTSYLQSLHYNKTFEFFTYIEEDYNLPPRLIYKDILKKERILYQSNKADTSILSLKQEIIWYTNSEDILLKGILYYPLHYLPSQKYPMVVHIYEKQNFLANRYPYPSYHERLGFNIRLLIEKGYFVYLPDIVIQGKNGPGTEALDCINSALDALLENPLIDTGKIGLIGHSFGGYETDFIATQSKRFAAYVSGSGHSDIIWAYHSFNYNFYFPDYVRIEANMYKFGKPFISDKDLYFKNNPVYYAEKVNAPVLLWTGLEDQNVTSDHSMAFYNALHRNKKDVIALFYKEEGHSLLKQQAQFDLTSRILDWFDYFLKQETESEWIRKGINKKENTKQDS